MSIEDALKNILENVTHQGGTTYSIEEKHIEAAKEVLSRAPSVANGKSQQIDTPYLCVDYGEGKSIMKCYPQCNYCKGFENEKIIDEDEPKLCECGHMDCQHMVGVSTCCAIADCNCMVFTEAEGPNKSNLFKHENLH